MKSRLGQFKTFWKRKTYKIIKIFQKRGLHLLIIGMLFNWEKLKRVLTIAAGDNGISSEIL